MVDQRVQISENNFGVETQTQIPGGNRDHGSTPCHAANEDISRSKEAQDDVDGYATVPNEASKE